MYYKLITAQLKNKLWQTVLFFLLLMITITFFCSSLNLYRNSSSNIEKAANAFSTIGVVEFFKNLNEYGQPVSATDATRIGLFSSTVEDLDEDALLSLPGVTNISIGRTFATYIPESLQYTEHGPEKSSQTFQGDIISFVLSENEEVLFDTVGKRQSISIKILDHANPIYSYADVVSLGTYSKNSVLSYQEDIDRLNGKNLESGVILFQPNVVYFASVEVFFPTKTSVKHRFYVNTVHTVPDLYGAEIYPRYYNGETIAPYIDYQASEDQPFWIWREDDLKQNAEVQAYYEETAEAIRYSNSSFAVMTTEDVENMLPFHQGKMAVAEGRVFSEEEYAGGSRVCMVSRKLAEIQGWKVGDTLPMHFYQYDGIYEDKDGNSTWMEEGHYIAYLRGNGGFFDQGDYTIVGIWDELPVQQSNGLDPRTDALLFNTILVPAASVENLDTVDAPASGSRLTVHLENGMMEEFLEAASQVTFSESADEVRITAFDQGYSQAQDSLQSMLGTAQFLLILSSVLLVVAGVLLAFFYTQSQKQNMALMRLLGCSRRQAGTMSMLGSLLILLPGGLLGMGAGHLLTDRVASAILNSANALDNPEYAGFREIFGVQAEVDFALSAQPAVSAAALAIAAALFLMGCLVFTLLLLRKEPREALADK